MSAISGDNVEKLKDEIVKVLDTLPEPKPLEFEEFTYTKPESLTWDILENEDGSYEIVGTLVDVLARNVVVTDTNSFGYMQKVLKDRGVFKKLRQMGANDGCTVVIGGIEFDYFD